MLAGLRHRVTALEAENRELTALLDAARTSRANGPGADGPPPFR